MSDKNELKLKIDLLDEIIGFLQSNDWEIIELEKIKKMLEQF